MNGLLAVLAVLLVGNVVDSLWIAYTSARDMNGGGYPILAHALISCLLLALVTAVVFLQARALKVEAPELWVLMPATIAAPVVHGAAIVWMERRGEARRAK